MESQASISNADTFIIFELATMSKIMCHKGEWRIEPLEETCRTRESFNNLIKLISVVVIPESITFDCIIVLGAIFRLSSMSKKMQQTSTLCQLIFFF
jgi:hypothetical protein